MEAVSQGWREGTPPLPILSPQLLPFRKGRNSPQKHCHTVISHGHLDQQQPPSVPSLASLSLPGTARLCFDWPCDTALYQHARATCFGMSLCLAASCAPVATPLPASEGSKTSEKRQQQQQSALLCPCLVCALWMAKGPFVLVRTQ